MNKNWKKKYIWNLNNYKAVERGIIDCRKIYIYICIYNPQRNTHIYIMPVCIGI